MIADPLLVFYSHRDVECMHCTYFFFLLLCENLQKNGEICIKLLTLFIAGRQLGETEELLMHCICLNCLKIW
jgi:hypothetical protein